MSDLSPYLTDIQIHSSTKSSIHYDIEREKSGNFKYYFSSLPAKAPLRMLVRLVKMRWPIERDYQDMKQQLGFDRYEDRSWEGFSPSIHHEELDMGNI